MFIAARPASGQDCLCDRTTLAFRAAPTYNRAFEPGRPAKRHAVSTQNACPPKLGTLF